jgi:hypothetical protein
MAASVPKMTVFMRESAARLEWYSLCGRPHSLPILSIDPLYLFDLTERLRYRSPLCKAFQSLLNVKVVT